MSGPFIDGFFAPLTLVDKVRESLVKRYSKEPIINDPAPSLGHDPHIMTKYKPSKYID